MHAQGGVGNVWVRRIFSVPSELHGPSAFAVGMHRRNVLVLLERIRVRCRARCSKWPSFFGPGLDVEVFARTPDPASAGPSIFARFGRRAERDIAMQYYETAFSGSVSLFFIVFFFAAGRSVGRDPGWRLGTPSSVGNLDPSARPPSVIPPPNPVGRCAVGMLRPKRRAPSLAARCHADRGLVNRSRSCYKKKFIWYND